MRRNMANKVVIEKITESDLFRTVRGFINSGHSVTIKDICDGLKNLNIVAEVEEIEKVLNRLVEVGAIEECGSSYLEPLNPWHDFA
ncbi:MAG: hypothetical protein A3I89_01550 [Candidatus Harrisonbacteria bacterium RIFCSPLOWO2_02_FULL_41_11]|nr:MAG: hypothetical protein A3I89_01550 [Candidatus Harrisonbacteria bacterium RIFCSPLOWO2_02_FULL_41_11]